MMFTTFTSCMYLIILISFAINFGNDLQRKVLHEKSVYTTKKLPYVTYDK